MWAYGDAILIQTTITIKINPHLIFIFWCLSSSGGIKFSFTTLIVVLSLLSLLFKSSFRVLISDLAFPSLVSLFFFLNRQSHSVTYMVWNSLCCPGWLQLHGSPLSSACQLVRMHMWIYHAWIHIDSCDSLTKGETLVWWYLYWTAHARTQPFKDNSTNWSGQVIGWDNIHSQHWGRSCGVVFGPIGTIWCLLS